MGAKTTILLADDHALYREGVRELIAKWDDFEVVGEVQNGLEAVEFCRKRGLTFYAVNSNHPPGYLFQGRSDKSQKVIADIYIDDHNLGGLPDWGDIYEMVTGVREERRKKRKRRSFWRRLFG